jgi:hypothetical protein
MTNAPETRKTHVIRIVGTNRAGDILQDIWVDVERIDATVSIMAGDAGGDANYQRVKRKFRWLDDPNGDDYNPDGNPERDTEIVKVCDPDSDNVDDPDEWIELRVIKKFKSVTSDNNYERNIEKLLNDEIELDSREFVVRKFVHYDTNIDDAAQEAFDGDESLKAYVVRGDEYEKDLDTKDEDQYVEHEVITKLFQRGNSTKRPNGNDQGRWVKLKNQYLIDESEEPDGRVVGSLGINPPYRLDPYQNIVNINFGALAVEFFDREN